MQGRRLTPSEIETVAQIYKHAASLGLPVTQAVAAQFGVGTSTAGKRIMHARAAGLLDDYGSDYRHRPRRTRNVILH